MKVHIFELRRMIWRYDLLSQLCTQVKKSGLNGIRAHDLCYIGAVLYKLSYQANWELATLWARGIPWKVKSTSGYMIYLNCGEWYEDMINWSSYLCTQLKQLRNLSSNSTGILRTHKVTSSQLAWPIAQLVDHCTGFAHNQLYIRTVLLEAYTKTKQVENGSLTSSASWYHWTGWVFNT